MNEATTENKRNGQDTRQPTVSASGPRPVYETIHKTPASGSDPFRSSGMKLVLPAAAQLGKQWTPCRSMSRGPFKDRNGKEEKKTRIGSQPLMGGRLKLAWHSPHRLGQGGGKGGGTEGGINELHEVTTVIHQKYHQGYVWRRSRRRSN